MIGLLIVIIFFTSSILFNSLKQPLIVIFIIPVSFIGIFLTFYWFKLNFDQGGFASFILLSGITINAGIYILDEYNRVRKRFPRLSPVRVYLKAWNAKIIPIFLTIISTVLGFIPFMVMNEYTEGGITFRNIWRILTEFYHGQYAPFNEYLYLVLYAFDGYNPFVFHLASLILHIINTCLVFLVIEKLLTPN